MKQTGVSVRLCALLLAAALLWRMLGAPLTAQDFANLKTPVWQAKILLPQRLERMLSLWILNAEKAAAQSMHQNADEANQEAVLVYLTQEEKLSQMTMQAYVCGVLAAEMPAQYHMEALKAQAVAARTRALWQKQQGGCALHPGADLCTDSAHCQGYASPDECRKRWGESYEAYAGRLIQAQNETAGQWIAYEDKPITVLYHANSGGRTENVQTVFAQSLPYLVSVGSEEDQNARDFQQETAFTYDEAAKKIGCSAEELRRSFSIGGYTESGRVSHVQIGEKKIEATELRKLLGLRSTWFSVTMNEEQLVFQQRGYGHGVGMSQAGANVMAASGADYRQILQHYYTGVEIVIPE